MDSEDLPAITLWFQTFQNMMDPFGNKYSPVDPA